MRPGQSGSPVLDLVGSTPRYCRELFRAVKRAVQDVPEEEWDHFANIAVIAPTTNIRIGAKSPATYLTKYDIGQDRLNEQLIDGHANELTIEAFLEVLAQQAKRLAQEINNYVAGLDDLTPYRSVGEGSDGGTESAGNQYGLRRFE
jgi:hypothetical protein